MIFLQTNNPDIGFKLKARYSLSFRLFEELKTEKVQTMARHLTIERLTRVEIGRKKYMHNLEYR